MHKKITSLISILVVTAFVMLAFSGCGNSISGGDEEDMQYTTSNTVFLPMQSVKSLNPVISNDEDTYFISKLIYEGLFELDSTLTPQMKLVESYEFHKDRNSIEMTLIPGIKWHDGKTLQADDVQFSVEAYKAAGDSSQYSSCVENINSVETKGDNSLEIYFYDENNIALDRLIFPILPAHRYDGGYDLVSQEEDFKPVGTGPYKYRKFNRRSTLELTAFDSYHGTKAQNTLIFEILPSKKNAFRLVESGNLSIHFDRAADRETKITNDDVKTVDFPSNQVEFVGFNFYNANISKKNVRHAISYAVDSKTIIEEAYYNTGMINDNIYFPDYLGQESGRDAYPYNLDKAAKLLKKSGYKDSDDDGYLEDSDGAPFILNILVNSDDEMRKVAAEIIKNALDKIEIETYIIECGWDEYLARLRSGSFDIYLGGYEMDESFDMRILLDRVETNYTGYYNGKVADLLNKMKSGLDLTTLENTFTEIRETIKEEVPYYCTLYKTFGGIKSPSLVGEVTPIFNNYYYNCQGWSSKYEVADEKADAESEE